MPDESTPPPETPPPYDPARRVGTGLAGETTRSEGTTLRRAASQHPLEVIGDFEVLAKLGQGGMGAVYRARQISLDRQVALKILPANFEADPDYVSRFQREARVAASLSHANLVKVYVSGLADGCHYIAMELIEGETLAQWIKYGAVSPLESLRIILDVARALECGWRSAQIVHRDIKPGNIFLSADGAVKLGDLGLAKLIGGDTTGLTQTGMMLGTPHYISPEQARGDRDIDFRADIYSLGCTLFQMLTRQTPYAGHEPMVVMNHHINSPPPAILKVMPHCPLPLGRLVSKMLKKQRRERHTSYEELIAAIESVRAQLDSAPSALAKAHSPTPLPPAPVQSAAVPRRAVQSEAKRLSAKGSHGPSSAKSKIPLYGGIAASAVAIGIVAWLAWPRGEKLTNAQRYAREHAGERQAGGEAASPAPAAEHWEDLLATPKRVSLYKVEQIGPAGIVLPQSAAVWTNGTYSDGAIRMVAIFDPQKLGQQLYARAATGKERYELHVTSASSVKLARSGGGSYQPLREFALPQPLPAGNEYEMEIRVTGDLVTAKLNGKILGEIRDGTNANGTFGVCNSHALPTEVRALHFLPLDAPKADKGIGASAALAPAAYPQPPKWIDATAAAFASKHLANGNLVVEGGWLKATKDLTLGVADGITLRNPILRVLFSGHVFLGVRRLHKEGGDWRYGAGIGQGYANIILIGPTPATRLTDRKLDSPDRPDGEHEAVFAAQGDALTLWLDGKVVSTAHDSTLSEGAIAIGFSNSDSRIKKVEYGELPDSAQPAAALLSPSAEPWQDVLDDPAKLNLSGGAERVPEGLRIPVAGAATLTRNHGLQRDGAVRILTTFGGSNVQLHLRETYAVGVDQITTYEKVIQLGRWDSAANRYISLREFPLRETLKPGQDYEIELRIVGQTLTAKFNGEIVGTAMDGTLQQGRFGIYVNGHNATPAEVKAFEVLDLDAPTGTSATAKEKP